MPPAHGRLCSTHACVCVVAAYMAVAALLFLSISASLSAQPSWSIQEPSWARDREIAQDLFLSSRDRAVEVRPSPVSGAANNGVAVNNSRIAHLDAEIAATEAKLYSLKQQKLAEPQRVRVSERQSVGELDERIQQRANWTSVLLFVGKLGDVIGYLMFTLMFIACLVFLVSWFWSGYNLTDLKDCLDIFSYIGH